MVSVTAIVLKAALLSLAVGLVISLAVGAIAVVSPDLARTLNRNLSHRVSMRRSTRFLEQPVLLERHFYRHHRIYGGLIVLLSLFLLHFLVFRFDTAMLSRVVSSESATVITKMAADLAQILMWIGSVFAFVIGIVMLVRPSALKNFERRSNQWLSTRRGMRALETDIGAGDSLFEQHPRVFGLVVSLLSLFCLIGIAVYWTAL